MRIIYPVNVHVCINVENYDIEEFFLTKLTFVIYFSRVTEKCLSATLPEVS